MSNGVYMDGKLTVGSTQPSDKTVTVSSVFGYDLRTVDQHIAALEQRLTALEQEKISSDTSMARLEERFKDLSVLYTQLQEIIRGEPPFLAPEGDWHMGE